MTVLITGALRSTSPDNRTTSKHDADDGSLDFILDHGADIHCVAADIDGNIYAGGVRFAGPPTAGVRKYNSAGTLQWSYDDGATVYGVQVDGSGNVYIATGQRARKLNSSGTSQWNFWHGNILNAIAIDSSGNVYAGGVLSSGFTLVKLNSSGTKQWDKDTGGTVTGVAVDSDGNVYAAMNSGSVKKYNSAGTEITTGWPISHGAWVRCLAVDGSDNLLLGGTRTSSITTRKYNSAGTLQWSADHGAAIYGIAVDAAGNVYTGGDVSSTYHTRRYPSGGGAPDWSINSQFRVTAVAVASSGLVTAVPALALNFALGMPYLTGYLDVPALALPFALAAPTSKQIGVITPDFADLSATVAELAADDPTTWSPYTGLSSAALATLAVPTYTAVTVGADSSMAAFTVESLQCNRRVNESSWVVATTTYSAAAFAALNATVGGELLIAAGFRLPHGAAASGPFLRMTLTEVTAAEGPFAGTISLKGRVINPPFTATTRALPAVARIQTDQGRRTVSCAAVDPLLRPNDTAVAGAESFTVGSIRYRIDPTRAEMTVVEAL